VYTLKISLVEDPRRCRAVVEGKVITPWVAAFETECQKAIRSSSWLRTYHQLKETVSARRSAGTGLVQLRPSKQARHLLSQPFSRAFF
jgi:hypothetical protein